MRWRLKSFVLVVIAKECAMVREMKECGVRDAFVGERRMTKRMQWMCKDEPRDETGRGSQQ